MATEVVRNFRSNKHAKTKNKNNKGRSFPGEKKGKKMDPRMKKLFRKRARDYNSDNSDDDEEHVEEEEQQQKKKNDDQDEYKSNNTSDRSEQEEEEEEADDDDEVGSDNDDEVGSDDDAAAVVQDGITKFSEGCRAFKMAFTKITSKHVPDELMGPVLSGHKGLIAEKLAEDESEKAAKGDAKKEKHLVAQKGHVIPAPHFLDSHQKFLIGVATKGVVKLFNAVNKAQNAQKGLNPSKFKDAKVLGKRKKDAFFSELRKKPSQTAGSLMGKASGGAEGDDEPAWAPLRDSYMLTNSKLKNWDKMPDKTSDDDMGGTGSHDSSSDED